MTTDDRSMYEILNQLADAEQEITMIEYKEYLNKILNFTDEDRKELERT